MRVAGRVLARLHHHQRRVLGARPVLGLVLARHDGQAAHRAGQGGALVDGVEGGDDARGRLSFGIGETFPAHGHHRAEEPACDQVVRGLGQR